MRSCSCCLFGRVPSQSLGVGLSPPSPQPDYRLPGFPVQSLTRNALVLGSLSVGLCIDVLLNVVDGLFQSLPNLLDVVFQARSVEVFAEITE